MKKCKVLLLTTCFSIANGGVKLDSLVYINAVGQNDRITISAVDNAKNNLMLNQSKISRFDTIRVYFYNTAHNYDKIKVILDDKLDDISIVLRNCACPCDEMRIYSENNVFTLNQCSSDKFEFISKGKRLIVSESFKNELCVSLQNKYGFKLTLCEN